MTVRCKSLPVMLAGLFFLQAPWAGATVWSPVVNIHPGTQGNDYFPRPAITPDGTPWVVWMGVDPIEFDQEVYYSRWDGLQWSPPQTVNPPNTTGDRIPNISCAPDGALWVLWKTSRGDGTDAYVGLASHWNGSSWAWPDTVWLDGGSYDNTDLHAVSSNEAWFIRHGSGGDIFVYRDLGGSCELEHRFDLPSAAGYQPTVAVDADGTVWAAWTHEEPPPTPDRLEFSRRVGGVWDLPRILPVPVETKLPRLAVDRDNVKWIVCAGDDPSSTYRGDDIWAIRWNGSDWEPPTRISERIQSNDSLQVYNAVSRTPGEYPRAVWVRANILNYTRYDVVTTAWDGSAWGPVELVGRLADSTYVNWPDVAVRDPFTWVTWMQEPKAPPYVWNIASIHSVPATTLAFFVDFSTIPAAEGVRIAWSMGSARDVVELRVLRVAGASSEARPPEGTDVVFEQSPQPSRGGSIIDRSLRNPGYYTYWLQVFMADGSTAWVGPRLSLYSPPLRSRLIAATPNPSGGGIVLRGIRGFDRPTGARIYGVGGRLVRLINVNSSDAALPAGAEFTLAWDGRGSDGAVQSSGIYFAHLVTVGPQPAGEGLKLILLR